MTRKQLGLTTLILICVMGLGCERSTPSTHVAPIGGGLGGPASGKPQINRWARKDFSDQLLKTLRSGFVPTVGFELRTFASDWDSDPSPEEFYQYLQSKKEVCSVAADFTGRYMFLQLRGAQTKLDLTIPLNENLEYRDTDTFGEGRVLRQVSLAYMDPVPRKSGGYTFNNVFLAFYGLKLTHVFAQEMVCATENCAQEEPQIVKNGFFYICSDNPNLYRPALEPQRPTH